MLPQLKTLIDDGYISVQKHPVADLWIYNYTQKTQFEGHWTNETMMCRGLILDAQDRTIARPFKKFKNLEEYGPDWTPPTESFDVTMKLDGSLGISYPLPDGTMRIATRGSFTSEQAQHASQVFDTRYLHLPWEPERFTYLFEIIYPENRIVVDYQGLDDLILLAVVDTQTGDELPLPDWFPNHVTKYDGITDLSTLKGMAKENEEGFVIRFASGFRLKVKFDEYVRLHRLVTGVNARRIWELLANGGKIDELVERVPEEFETWVRKTAIELATQYQAIRDRAWMDHIECKVESDNRKEFALLAQQRANPSILFAMYDEKPYDHIIWKMIKPAAERPFKPSDE